MHHATAVYRTTVPQLARAPGPLPNLNLDTGDALRAGTYGPADEAYATLLDRLADRGYADVPSDLRTDILRHFGSLEAAAAVEDDDEREKVTAELARLEASATGK